MNYETQDLNKELSLEKALDKRRNTHMEQTAKAYALFWDLYHQNENFKNLVITNMENGKIRFFNDEEWKKIRRQNFISPTPYAQNFIDMFALGFNIGNCVGMSRQLSYSYHDVDIVSGRLPILKGTLNAEQEGGHCWLERNHQIIDTSLMLVIDVSLKKEFGYLEEERLTSFRLANSPFYQARKSYVNDKEIRDSRLK